MKRIINYIKTNINLIKDNKGAVSIPFIIVMFIVVLFIAGYVDIMRKSFVAEEFQGIMDLAGIAALREGIDDAESFEKDMDGNIIYNQTVIRSTFISLLDKQIQTNASGPIISYKVNNITITELNNSKWGLGVAEKGRNQLVLDTIVTVVVPVSSSLFDDNNETKYTFFNQLENTKFTIVSQNKKDDNKEEIVIRSVTRLVK